MNTYDIYVHGTPRGHQVMGSDYNRSYIDTFYNHDSQAYEKAVLQIDVCGGDSFYTYIRRQDVCDFEGRPNAFFALTVGIRKAFCTNVYRLYQLFEAVYSQICVGSILKQSGNGEQYSVADLNAARSGANATVERIMAAFTQKINELINPTLQPLLSDDTFNRAKKKVCLLEVDSPLFFDYFKRYSIVVSPDMQPYASAYEIVANELRQLYAQKKDLDYSYGQLQSKVSLLSQENKSLSDQLHESTSSAEKKYKTRLTQLQNDLNNVTKERDSLKRKIEEVADSIGLIDRPFQKLTSLMTGSFSENRPQGRNVNPKGKHTVNQTNQKSTWRDWINSILLGIVLLACICILYVVLKN